MDDAPRNMGHNNPPIDPALLLESLALTHADIANRADELMAAMERVPEEVTDDAMAGKFADQASLINTCIKKAEAARKAEKEQFLEAGRAVQDFFVDIKNPLEKAKATLTGRLTVYQRKKADEERRRLEEEARIAREEAERKAAEACNEEDLDAAVRAEEDAAKADLAAHAPTAELSQSRGQYGGMGSLRTTWEFEVRDHAAVDFNALRSYLSTDAIDKAIRAFIRAGGRELTGVRIFQDQKTTVR